MRKGRRNFFLTPRLCSIEEYSVRTEKKTPQHKSTYTINTTLQQGETYPALASSRPVQRHLLRRWSQTRLTKPGGTKPEALGRGRGIMSVIGEVARESHCSALSRVVIQHGLGRARCRYGGARKRSDWIVVSLGRTAAYFHSYSLCPFCPFWSPKAYIFTCKAVSFIVIESIFRLIVSVSMLTALPTASTKTGSLVRLWTAVPVFWIFR